VWADRVLFALWWINLVALVGLCVWAFVDARFGPTAYFLKADVQHILGRPSHVWTTRSDALHPRMSALFWTLVCGAASGVILFVALFVGPRRHRRLHSWLTFTGLLAGWLAAFVSWPEIAWRGQQGRLRAELAGFEKLAQSLRNDWPRIDEERPGLGPFMAYPIGQPTMIMLLTSPKVTPSDISIAAVERQPSGALCFQLSEDETGAWLEWHPRGQAPSSFVGGLLDEHSLVRAAELERGWFLVRYREPRVRSRDEK
jgi:hypothetical protein